VIRSVVGDQVDLGPPVISDELVQELDEGLGVEHLHEPGMPLGLGTDSDCAHHFYASANRRASNLDSDAHRRPCPDDRSGLLKHRFVLIQGYALLPFSFF